jgi:ketosteroid isomerase-like protein
MNATLTRYFKAMQRGPEGVAELIALFTDDAVYVEPFSPGGGFHVGKAAIEGWLSMSQQSAPPAIELSVDRIDAHDDEIEVAWTCESAAFSRPSRGVDRFTLRDGMISRLETRLTQLPELR